MGNAMKICWIPLKLKRQTICKQGHTDVYSVNRSIQLIRTVLETHFGQFIDICSFSKFSLSYFSTL